MGKKPDEPEDVTNKPLPSMSEPTEVQDDVASTLATPFAQPIITASKSKAQKQRQRFNTVHIDTQRQFTDQPRQTLATEPAETTLQSSTSSDQIEVQAQSTWNTKWSSSIIRFESTSLDNDFGHACSVDLKPTAAQLKLTMQQSNAAVKTERQAHVNNCDFAQVYIEPKAEFLKECSRINQDKCQETSASTVENEEAKPLIYEGPYRGLCQQCNQRFTNLLQFQYHMKTMHDEEEPSKLNKCNICLYEFVNNSALVNHMRLHTGEKPFACETCGKKFAFKVALVRHYCIDGEQPYMRKVTIEKPKVCDVCHAQFKSNTSLNKHKRKHTSLKPFGCNMCHKNFRFKTALVSHVCINDAKPKIKTENSEFEMTIEPIGNIETVKVEKIESETDIEVKDRIDINHRVEKSIEPIDNIKIAKVESIETGTDIDAKDRVEIKIERDELELGDTGMAEIMIEAIKTEIKEEY
ncbi:zinc finger protein 184-like isoform X2 [Maniola jurtina]|uniref:zinc finger protein 184-like isoform X2 n=1 Tax=Maniola jurtina TaxID=191418 RepID=UPI001E68D639|nr:zinc finger protein 184-like isoform X2 [Maniola jurtina]